MASPTTNKGYTYPAHGGAVNAWDSPLNTNFDQIDQNVGGVYNVVLGSTIAGTVFNSTYCTASSTVVTVTFASSNAQNMYYNVSGTISSTTILSFPAVGSFYIVNNAATGASVRINTTASATSIAVSGFELIVTDGTDARGVVQSAEFASGTALIFASASPPSGWTQDTTITGNAVAIISSAATANTSASGTWTISGLTVGNTTLTTAQIPSHTHTYNATSGSDTFANGGTNARTGTSSFNTGSAGTGGSHTHTATFDGTWRPKYYMVLRATKN